MRSGSSKGEERDGGDGPRFAADQQMRTMGE
jgi:hypothetical protein